MIKRCFFLLLYCVHLQSFAGTRCDNTTFDPAAYIKAGDQAAVIEKILIKQKPQVALIARVGSDLSKYQLHYTHIAFLVKNTSEKHWSVIHLLNHCETSTSSIYRQGLMNFFLDNVYNYEAKVVIPSEILQNKLLSILVSKRKLNLHNKRYSMIAYPYSNLYQNSNQWVLEIIASALSGYNNRTDLQSWLRENNYQPGYISIPKTKRMIIKLFKNNITFEDHPKQERDTKIYSFVSAESVFDFLHQKNEIIFDKEFG